MTYRDAIYKELYIEIEAIKKAIVQLDYAFEKCTSIGLKNEYSAEELIMWEGFTARHSRLSDILTQKVLNNFIIIETLKKGTINDKANFAVAQGWIDSIDEFRKLRNIRNFIAHEYIHEDVNIVFESVTNSYSLLKKFAEKIILFYESNPIYKL